MNYSKLIFILFLLSFKKSFAQQHLPVPRNIRDTYKKDTRSESGMPGKNYWQNTADYLINISFNPETRLISGNVAINYTNNSPDTLISIWFKLYPNLYKRGSPRAMKIDSADVNEGVIINSMTINGEDKNVKAVHTDGTNMTVPVKKLIPGGHIRFLISYQYTLNKKSHIRTGEIEPGADFVAYFFPRIAVYDDIDGWNKYPYTGAEEFYNDFCSFTANISVPVNYVVWATGILQNCSEVLNDTYCRQIEQAEKSDTVINIIDTADLSRQNITVQKPENTWKFEAKNVTDFVFATSNHYIWKSSSLMVDSATRRRTRVDAAFNPVHKDYYDVINHARATVLYMSYNFPRWPYPYPHETVFDGLDQMEYPMMVNDNPLPASEDEIELTDHEIFHTMFPFYMGINETKYAWMDEGWATIGEWLISPMIDSSIIDEYGVSPYEKNVGNETDVPIITISPQQHGFAYYLNAYPKPAFGYLYVRDLLGDELFTKALHHYITQWHGKHPMPFDFFNCINAGSGQNLNWFWKRWFFEGGVPDLAIASVTHKNNNYMALITSKGSKPVPIDLTVYFTDSSVQKFHRSIAVWQNADTASISFKTEKQITKLILDGTYNPDINKEDNEWEVK